VRQRQKVTDRPGTVVLLSAELGRYTAAQQCFDALEVPPGTTRVRHAGRSDLSGNRNAIVEAFRGDWLAMIDDDQVYEPGMLLRLLQHLRDPRVDIVTPLILRRKPPHYNVLVHASTDSTRPHETRQVVLKATDRGLLEVGAAGAGVMLLRRRVFERVPRPWFEWGRNSEDFTLCLKAKAAGCGIYCDLDTRVGHIVPMIVWPARAADGTFGAMYSNLLSVGSADHILDGIRQNYADTDKRVAGGRGRGRTPRRSQTGRLRKP
jgi:glycosyltransferase involved in cell wall biosynthesis